MLEKLQSVLAAEQARSTLNLANNMQELADRLCSLMVSSADQWQGGAQRSFQRALEDLSKRLIHLTGKAIQVSNNILRVAENCERAEASSGGSGGGRF